MVMLRGARIVVKCVGADLPPIAFPPQVQMRHLPAGGRMSCPPSLVTFVVASTTAEWCAAKPTPYSISQSKRTSVSTSSFVTCKQGSTVQSTRRRAAVEMLIENAAGTQCDGTLAALIHDHSNWLSLKLGRLSMHLGCICTRCQPIRRELGEWGGIGTSQKVWRIGAKVGTDGKSKQANFWKITGVHTHNWTHQLYMELSVVICATHQHIVQNLGIRVKGQLIWFRLMGFLKGNPKIKRPSEFTKVVPVSHKKVSIPRPRG